jgi:hypothetical protein
MLRKTSIILTILIIIATTVVCNIGGAAPDEKSAEIAAESTPVPAEEPTDLPIEEDIEQVATPTPEPTPTLPVTPTAEPIAALTAAEAYDLTLAEARTWQPDAVLTEMQTSSLGPLDSEGYSQSWAASYWSPSAKEVNSMIVIEGALNASPVAMPVAQKAVPDIEAVIMDTQSLYNTAAATGGADYLEAGYSVSAGLTRYPLDESMPTWYMHFHDPADSTLAFTVIIDARSGEVIQAIPLDESAGPASDTAAGAGDVDFTNPVAVLQAVFVAANTGEFEVLQGLCDPLAENDADTQNICDVATDDTSSDSFVEFFSTGQIAGGVEVSEDGSQIEIPFLFGPDGQREETMTLINRSGNWYLYSF